MKPFSRSAGKHGSADRHGPGGVGKPRTGSDRQRAPSAWSERFLAYIALPAARRRLVLTSASSALMVCHSMARPFSCKSSACSRSPDRDRASALDWREAEHTAELSCRAKARIAAGGPGGSVLAANPLLKLPAVAAVWIGRNFRPCQPRMAHSGMAENLCRFYAPQ